MQNKKMSRRELLRAMLFTTGGALLTACAPATQKTQSEPAPEEKATEVPVQAPQNRRP